MASTEHLSDETLAAAVEGRLTPQERRRVLRHLAACPQCTAAWTALHAMLQRAEALPPTPLEHPLEQALGWLRAIAPLPAWAWHLLLFGLVPAGVGGAQGVHHRPLPLLGHGGHVLGLAVGRTALVGAGAAGAGASPAEGPSGIGARPAARRRMGGGGGGQHALAPAADAGCAGDPRGRAGVGDPDLAGVARAVVRVCGAGVATGAPPAPAARQRVARRPAGLDPGPGGHDVALSPLRMEGRGAGLVGVCGEEEGVDCR